MFLSILGLLLLGVATYVISKPADVFCKWMETHNYSEAIINDDGNWETTCKTKGCGSTLVLKGHLWKEKER